MGFFGMLFWLAVIWFAFRVFQRWTCESGGHWRDHRLERRDPVDQQPYIESLESRIAELEERLDFTERLVAERKSVAHPA